MMRRSRPLFAMALLVVAASCGPLVVLDDEGTDGSDDDDGTTTTTTTTTTAGPTTSSTSTTTQGPSTTPPPPVDDTNDDDPPDVLDLFPERCFDFGEPCLDGSFDCCSGNCYVVGPLGGVCSECDEDSDCRAWGCSPGSPIAGLPAYCGNGLEGSGCQTHAACQPGLVCETIVDIPGIVTTSTCGQCSSDAECPPGNLCAPVYDLFVLGGYWYCAPQGGVPLGAGCDESGTGDLQCASGHCAPASLMGIPLIAVCSACDEDVDCPGGSCVLPEVVIDPVELVVEPGYCT